MDTVFTKIRKAVVEAQKFPNPIIQYSFNILELTHDDGGRIKPNRFYGVKAVFNPMVPKDPGYSVTFKYS